MLGLLGILGALFAGVVVDTVMSVPVSPNTSGEDDVLPADDDEDFVHDGSYDLLAEAATPTAQPLDDPAGMPISDDTPDSVDPALSLNGGDASDILDGFGGDDAIWGGAGNDLLGGRDGADSLDGGIGDDNLHGGGGDDGLTGGDGDDVLHGEDGDDTLTGDLGADGLFGHEGDDSLAGAMGDDSLGGGGGDDRLTGDDGDDVLAGGSGADLLGGGRGSDQIEGGDGADTLWGGDAGTPDAEADFLNGGAGDDLLMLGAGDYANGGEGEDAFALQDLHAGDPVAQITDFDPAEDTIVVIYDATLHPQPVLSLDQPDGGSTTLLLDGVPLVNLGTALGIDLETIQLRAG